MRAFDMYADWREKKSENRSKNRARHSRVNKESIAT